MTTENHEPLSPVSAAPEAPEHPVLARTFDPSKIVEIAAICGDSYFISRTTARSELPGIVSAPACVTWITSRGAMIFRPLYKHTYELILVFPPDIDIDWVKQAVRDAILLMMTHSDCLEVHAWASMTNRLARNVLTDLCFAEEFSTTTADGMVPIDHFALRYENWVLLEPRVRADGETFHVELHRQGLTIDADHPRKVFTGVAVQCIVAGQVDKGIALYNRFAAQMDLAPWGITGISPVRVDIGGQIVEITSAGVTLCSPSL